MATSSNGRRRSPRLQALAALRSTPSSNAAPETTADRRSRDGGATAPKRKRNASTAPTPPPPGKKTPPTVPRTRETHIHSLTPGVLVIGIDEAGRGPLAGPVVAAAAIVPAFVPGVTDSKLLTSEVKREELYGEITASPGARWAVAVVDAVRIDEINILQASLEAMRYAACALVDPGSLDGGTVVGEASVELSGSYVVCQGRGGGVPPVPCPAIGSAEGNGIGTVTGTGTGTEYYAIVDGNKLPKDMPCGAETMVKGDSREYCIAAASILAKVTRDRLMHGYDALYPKYNLAKHKGYPTAAHRAAVKEYGASPIHRRTFAPLKHMTFDEDGGIITDSS